MKKTGDKIDLDTEEVVSEGNANSVDNRTVITAEPCTVVADDLSTPNGDVTPNTTNAKDAITTIDITEKYHPKSINTAEAMNVDIPDLEIDPDSSIQTGNIKEIKSGLEVAIKPVEVIVTEIKSADHDIESKSQPKKRRASSSPERVIRSRDAGGGLKIIDIVKRSKLDHTSPTGTVVVDQEDYWASHKFEQAVKVFSKPRIFEVGSRLIRNGCVSSMLSHQEEGGLEKLTATVIDEQTNNEESPEHHVTIKLQNAHIISTSCKCDYSDILWCSHIVATILARYRNLQAHVVVADNKDGSTKSESEETANKPAIVVTDYEELKKSLNKKKKYELLELVLNLASNQKCVTLAVLDNLSSTESLTPKKTKPTSNMVIDNSEDESPTKVDEFPVKVDIEIICAKIESAFARDEYKRSRRSRDRHQSGKRDRSRDHKSSSSKERGSGAKLKISAEERKPSTKTKPAPQSSRSVSTTSTKASDKSKLDSQDASSDKKLVSPSLDVVDSKTSSKSQKSYSAKDDKRFAKDCCGCSCHKVFKRFSLDDRECKLCEGFHRRARYSSICENVIDEAAEVVEKMVDFGLKSRNEMQSALCLFRTVSTSILNGISVALKERSGEITHKGIRKIVDNICVIFRKVFLSTNLSKDVFDQFSEILSQWKKVFPTEAGFKNAGEQGWHGPQIIKVLNGDPATLGNFSESVTVREERLRILERQKRFQEALFYSCATENKRSIAICLANLGRVDEALKVGADEIKRFSIAFDFANIIKKFDSNKAFQFLASRLSTEFTLRKANRSTSKELIALEWLAKTAEEKHGHGKIIERLVGAFSNMPADLIFVANYVKKAGLGLTALRICIDMIMRSGDRMTSSIWKWIARFSIEMGQDAVTQVSIQATKIVKYESKICATMLPTVESFSKAGFVSDGFQIALHTINLLFGHLSHKNSSISEIFDKTERSFILMTVELACRSKLDPSKKASQTLEKISPFSSKNIPLLFEICEIVAKAKLYNVALEQGKRIFCFQLAYSRRGPMVCQLTKWLLQTSYDLQQLRDSTPNIGKMGGKVLPKVVRKSDLKDTEKSATDNDIEMTDANNKKEPMDIERKDFDVKQSKALSVTKPSAVLFMVSFLSSNLKRVARSFAQQPLLDIADFLHEKVKSDLEAVKIAKSALEIEFKKDSDVMLQCAKYFELARSIGEIDTAQLLSKRLLDLDPNPENFARVASVYDEESPEWGIFRDDIIKTIMKKPGAGSSEDRSGSAVGACNRVQILLQEELPAEDISNFMRQEVESFTKPEFSIELMKIVLKSIDEMEKDEQSVLQEIWFGGIHFNIVVAVLKGLSEKLQMEFFEYLSSLFPDFKSKAANAFVFALTSVIKKRTKYVTIKKLNNFFQYLKHTQVLFEQAGMELKWYELLKFIRDSNKNRQWFTEPFDKWKSESNFQSATIVLDD